MDELERVAASYLLNPRGSATCSSSSLQDDETYVDDGSVYIYKEDTVSSSQHEDWGERGDYEDEEDGLCATRHTASRNVARHNSKRDVYQNWETGRHDDVPLPTRAKDADIYAQKRGGNPNRIRRDYSRQEVIESNDTVRRQDDFGRGSGERAEKSLGARNGIDSRDLGGDTAAGMCRSDSGGKSSQKRLAACTCAHEMVRDEGGDLRLARMMSHRLPKENDGRRESDSSVRFDDLGAPRANNCLQVDAPQEESKPVLTDINYSPNVDRRAQVKKRGNGTTYKHGRNSSAKLSQVATRLREMILERQASAGRPIRQIFGHFDRNGCGYVKADELRDALADLRLNVSPKEAQVS